MAESHPKTYPCDHVDLDFIARAPFRFVSTVDLAITPEQLFEVLADAESWPHWATLITNVVWTSPEPDISPSLRSPQRGIGTTRTVSMRGNIVGDEEFIAWEPFSHMAFRFNQSTSNALSAFAEDYRVVPTADGCHLTWVMAMKPSGVAGRLGMTFSRPVMAWLFQRFLHNLRKCCLAPTRRWRHASDRADWPAVRGSTADASHDVFGSRVGRSSASRTSWRFVAKDRHPVRGAASLSR